ncbi:CTLH/CRA C-terminal to lish motif domain-containing protein [Echria macrotheca]|uniref:CTLH/CRA C-terminal to lish motif domain-containing protein n=1 Tax=Echria macrotheca TaxID=438768 RepID=A0AAJ0F8C3_9PEZI|nr:CTLH/CRA C-terminal to lish motif domain-containing protein [Echria macrotheca]
MSNSRGTPRVDIVGSSPLRFALSLGDFTYTITADGTAQMTSSTSTTTPKHAFDSRVTEVKSNKSDINALVLDYLTMEGYTKAAAKFSKEANLPLRHPEDLVAAQQNIKLSILRGDIETAISGINELDHEILDKDPQLHFSLLRLQLVELIRRCNNNDVTPAIEFAQEKLAPRAAMNEEFLPDLEKTMSLFFFPHDSLVPELAALLKSDLRRTTATKVNEAILRQQANRREAAIRGLVRLRAWTEASVRTKRKDLPDRIELGVFGDGAENNDGGPEPMITT